MRNMRNLRIAIFESVRIAPGGGQKVMPLIAQHLSKKHDVTVFTQKEIQGGLDYGRAKIKIIRPANTYLANIAFFLQKATKKDFDFIIYGCYPAAFSAFRSDNLPSIHIAHSPPRAFYDLRTYLLKNSNWLGKLKVIIKSILYKKLDYLAVRKSTLMLGISKEIKERIRKFYKRNSEIFYPGINPLEYSTGKYENYILAAGRFEINKRSDMIVKSMGFIKNRHIKLVMVGSGTMSEEIKQLSKKYDNIEFRGFVSKEELKKLYSNCLAAIYVPVQEDYGYVPVEAAASGKACIGSNEGGLKETIIHGKTGFLINDVTPEKIAEKIDFFANNEKIAIKMGKNAKEYSKKFYWKEAFKIIDKSIEDSIKLHAKNEKK